MNAWRRLSKHASACAILAWLTLATALASCYSERNQEQALGTIGKQAVKSAVAMFTQAQMDAKEAERLAEVAKRIEVESRAAAAEAQLDEQRKLAERLERVNRLHRKEIDRLKQSKGVLLAHLDNIATAGVRADCPLGDAARIRAVWRWMRDNDGNSPGTGGVGDRPAPGGRGPAGVSATAGASRRVH